ncbi:proline and serine-rich protein 2 [Ictalurus furcatus]|uniref:proline and serine-rich protein 2 n=1 Tax=Ictalurus furcatus TaxID=66913 RepID=UPI0023503D00|nr:proline and serine-rich protein 2 [Ictalurus furcatus]
MDVNVHGNPRLHYRLNNYQQTNDDGLQFLSVEEKECILFFEETIDSLEDGLDDSKALTSRRSTPAEILRASSNSALSSARAAKVSPGLMEHDIIDLVHSPTNLTVPDFPNIDLIPEPHYETIPQKVSVVPSSARSSDAHEENNHQPPPGSVPTPVVIASKISEHQGAGGITPSKLLGHRRSLESKRNPPMPTRIPQLPHNISMTQGNQELSHQSLATAAVNIQERRSQMLANLPAGNHPLEGGEPACVRNVPIRSVSFKDIAPEKSRMEALSKLGLTGGKTPHSTASMVTKVSSSTTSPYSSSYKVSSSASPPVSSSNKVSVSTPAHMTNMNSSKNSSTSGAQSIYSSGYETKPKSEPSSSNFNYYKGKTAAVSPIAKNTAATFNQQRRSSIPPTSAEVKQPDFNSYGGKTIVLNTTIGVKAESVPSPNTPEPAETQFNSYGGRSRVINSVVNTGVPDGVNSAHSHTRTSTVTPTTHHGDPTRSRYPSEQNTYDAKPKAALQPDPVYQPIVRTRPATLPPPTTSKPQSPFGSQRPRPDPVPPEILSKPAPSFRNQGVTVQFSGRGTTGESRRDALRRLGLLKNTS